MPRVPAAPLVETPPAESPQTAIAPPRDLHDVAPPPGPLEMTARTAPTLKTIWHAQRVWYELATRSWLRLAAVPIELVGCRSLDALLELQRRHITGAVNDALAGYAELAALSGDPMPGRVGAAGVGSTGV